ncbi:unnamed protein product [Miscanthus lutarioriparius]|uniref:EXPERA domain-containing protein n=1 Tax=Miscanthus lutarioriparius TaxID=422564 RepID=A0A811N3H6_9POAL|nr:unnamed protein product [Miscanthus lutarioriparius]
MAVASAALDAVVALFSLIMAVAAPLFDSQVVLPLSLYPALLVDVFRWFIAEFDNYSVADRPPFLRGLVWLDLAFLWPSAMFGEMLGSGKATPKLLGLYLVFVVFAISRVASAPAQHRRQVHRRLHLLRGRRGSRSLIRAFKLWK